MELLRNKDTIERLIFLSLCGLFFFIPIATSLAVIAGALSLVIWIFSGKFIKDRDLWLKEEWFLPVILFMLLPWIGLLWSKDLTTGLNFAKKSHYWLFTFAIASLPFQKYPPKILLNAFLLGLSLTAVVSIAQFIGIFPLIKDHIGLIPPITYSLLVLFGILLLSFYFNETPRRNLKIYLFLLMVLLFITLAITGKRAGYLAFILLCPLIVYKILGQKEIFKIAILSLLLMAVMFLFPTVQGRVSQAVEDLKLYREGNPNTSVGLRLHMWSGAIRIFLENPLIGVGTGGYRNAMKRYETPQLAPEFREFSHPHNSFLYMAANHGVVGLILLLWLFFIFLKAGWRHRNNLIGFSILAFGLVILIGSLTDTQIIEVHTGMLFALFMGLQRALKGE